MMNAIEIIPFLLAQVAPRDTVVMMVARDGFTTIASIADIIVTIALLVFLSIITILFFQLRQMAKLTLDMMKRFEMDPLLDRSRRVAENIDFITLSVRTDVEKVSERLSQASDLMEERISDFNALMEVVQEETEGAFVQTASAVRGVRAGARDLKRGRQPAPPASRLTPVRDRVIVEIDDE